MHFTKFERLSRDEHMFSRLFEGATRFDVQLIIGNNKLDLVSDSGRTVAAIEGGRAAGDRKGTNTRTTGGVLQALHSGHGENLAAWPYAEGLLPLGYALVLNDNGRPITRAGGSGSRWRLLAPAANEVEPLREVLRLAAEGARWVDCAAPLIAAGIAQRGTRVPANSVYSVADRARLGSFIRSVVGNPIYQELWLTGRYRRAKSVPVANNGIFEGFPVDREGRHGTYGVVKIDADFTLPRGGFVSQETMDLIKARLMTRERETGDRTRCSLFTFVPDHWVGEGPEAYQRRLKRVVDSYVVVQRPQSSAFDTAGRPRGWRQGEGLQILTVRRADLERSVAEGVAAAVHALADQRLSIDLTTTAPSRKDTERLSKADSLDRRAAESRLEAQEWDDLARISAAPPADHGAVKRHTAAASLAFEEAERLEKRAEDIRETVERSRSSDVHEVEADLGSVAAVAGALRGYAGRDAPIEINQALMTLGFESLRLQVSKHNASVVEWEVSLDLPLVGGEVAQVLVNGTVQNRRRDGSRGGVDEVNAAIAEGFLKRGEPIEQLCATFGRSRRQIVVALRAHLAAHGVVKRGLRSAVVDLPPQMKQTRSALWDVLSQDRRAPNHEQAWREHLDSVYRGDRKHPNAWVRTDTSLVRRVLRVMVEALSAPGANGVSVSVLANTVGATRTEINGLCRDRNLGTSIRSAFPGVLVRDPLNADVVRLRLCPHNDCSAAQDARWLSYYLPVPETDAYLGLLCLACHRLPHPELASLRFPDEYFENLWNGFSDAVHCNLEAAQVTHSTEASDYEPGTRMSPESRIYSIIEVGVELGITDSAVRGWIKDPDNPLAAKRMSGRGLVKYGVTAAELERARSSHRLPELLARSPRPKAVDGDFITLAELSALLDVPEHYLRRYARAGNLGKVERRSLTGTGQASMIFSRDVVNVSNPAAGTDRMPADWITRHRNSYLLIKPAAARARVTTGQLRDASNEGEIVCHLTDGGTRRYAVEDVEAWAQARSEFPLTPKEAREYAGVSEQELRNAILNRDIAVRRTPGGHYRHSRAELDRLKDARTGARPD